MKQNQIEGKSEYQQIGEMKRRTKQNSDVIVTGTSYLKTGLFQFYLGF
jgi:hypothetical protein